MTKGLQQQKGEDFFWASVEEKRVLVDRVVLEVFSCRSRPKLTVHFPGVCRSVSPQRTERIYSESNLSSSLTICCGRLVFEFTIKTGYLNTCRK
jgi:hypothetical protein